MESRPKRSTRNQNPSYTFQKEEDFFRRHLSEKRKNDILALIKSDLAKSSKAADVGSAKYLEKLGREFGVLPKQMRQWLGITDNLTEVTSGSNSSEKGTRVGSQLDEESRAEVLAKLNEQLQNLQREFEELRRRKPSVKLAKQHYEEELMDVEEESQDATEGLPQQVQEAKKPREEESVLVQANEESSVQVESPILVESMHLSDSDEEEEKGVQNEDHQSVQDGDHQSVQDGDHQSVQDGDHQSAQDEDDEFVPDYDYDSAENDDDDTIVGDDKNAVDEDDQSAGITPEERHSAFLNKWQDQMEKMQAAIKQDIVNRMEVESESWEQSVGSPRNSEYETADDADDFVGESQEQQSDLVDNDGTLEPESWDEDADEGKTE